MYLNITDLVRLFRRAKKTAPNDIVEIEMEEFNNKEEVKKGGGWGRQRKRRRT